MIEDLLEQLVRIYSYFPQEDGHIFKNDKAIHWLLLKTLTASSAKRCWIFRTVAYRVS